MEAQKWYKNPEMLVALTALFIGLVTAAISIYSAYIDRAYAKASVWPKVELSRSFIGNSFSYGVTNNGTGPALIQYATVRVNGNYIKHWSDLPEYSHAIQSHFSTLTLPSGHHIKPIEYKGEGLEAVLKLDNSVEIELCYCSIYADCWVVNRSNTTRQVEICEVSREKAFLE